MASFYEQVAAVAAQGRPFALAILASIKGSSPQKRGAKALFLADGTILGTLGGGCLEAEIQERARRALVTGRPHTFDLLLDHDFGWDDGLICGGRVCGLILPAALEAAPIWTELARRDTVRTWGVRPDFSIAWLQPDESLPPDAWLYWEHVPRPVELWIAGAGHVAQATAPIATALDFAVTVFDDRPALASARLFPAATRFRVDAWERLLQDTPPPFPTFGLVLTRGHQHDARVLSAWIQQPFAFLGMIGSRRKKRLIFDQFLADGIATEQQLARVHCPVGLDIGSVSVTEIGVSIAAQLVQARANLSATRIVATTPQSSPSTAAGHL